MEHNRVKVKIYGQEYVIAGEMSREDIIKVAAYVDNKMME
ncbi:MAG: cell division protein ZapA, partial [Firmicutes bacterium]|nr:cell division protein ZapA [Bacillota bacterium]